MYKHILVAVAFHDEAEHARSIDVAKTLADKNTRVSVLHVREAIPTSAMMNLPEDFITGLRRQIQVDLDELAKGFDNGTGVLVDGHSGRTILEWAEANEVDCIVLSSHQPGLQDYLLGSTAGRVVRHAHCSVHVVR